MRFFLTNFFITCLILYPAICMPAEHLITLHNGGKLLVDGYSEEGNRLVFNIFGGSVVIDKEWVKSITKIEKNKPGPKQQEELTPHQKEKLAIRDQLLTLYKLLDNDKKNGRPSRVAKRMLQIGEVRNKLANLAERVKKKNNGELPQWWDDFKVPYLKKK